MLVLVCYFLHIGRRTPPFQCCHVGGLYVVYALTHVHHLCFAFLHAALKDEKN